MKYLLEIKCRKQAEKDMKEKNLNSDIGDVNVIYNYCPKCKNLKRIMMCNSERSEMARIAKFIEKLIEEECLQ